MRLHLQRLDCLHAGNVFGDESLVACPQEELLVQPVPEQRRNEGAQQRDEGEEVVYIARSNSPRVVSIGFQAGARVPAHQLPPVDADLVAVEQPNSIALRMAMVAADEADLLATLRWGWEWDIGAAALIAREAGAAVTDAFGQALGYNKPDPRAFGVLVTAPAIHGAAVDRLADRARELAAR